MVVWRYPNLSSIQPPLRRARAIGEKWQETRKGISICRYTPVNSPYVTACQTTQPTPCRRATGRSVMTLASRLLKLLNELLDRFGSYGSLKMVSFLV